MMEILEAFSCVIDCSFPAYHNPFDKTLH